ncbi:hypothetical protein KCTC52924_02219 [Arenibacter antarcticus]
MSGVGGYSLFYAKTSLETARPLYNVVNAPKNVVCNVLWES